MAEILRTYKTCRRWNNPWDAHELTFSCFAQRAFLSSDRTRAYLAKAILAAKIEHAFDLWGYVFMPEHVHLLVWPTCPEYSISAILQAVKQSVSRRAVNYLRQHNPDGLRALATGQNGTPYSFWRAGGGFDRNVSSRDVAWRMINYMHDNPVRRGLVARPEDWAGSSYRDWQGLAPGPLPIDKESLSAQ